LTELAQAPHANPTKVRRRRGWSSRPRVADALRDLRPGTEILVLTWLDRADRGVLLTIPRGDPRNPMTGVFSTRSPDRPNPIGLHRVQVIAVRRPPGPGGSPRGPGRDAGDRRQGGAGPGRRPVDARARTPVGSGLPLGLVSETRVGTSSTARLASISGLASVLRNRGRSRPRPRRRPPPPRRPRRPAPARRRTPSRWCNRRWRRTPRRARRSRTRRPVT